MLTELIEPWVVDLHVTWLPWEHAESPIPCLAATLSTSFSESHLLLHTCCCSSEACLLLHAGAHRCPSSLQLVDRGNQWARLTPHAGCVHFHTANATVSLDSMLSSYPGPLQLVTAQVGRCAVPGRATQAPCSLSRPRWAAVLCLKGLPWPHAACSQSRWAAVLCLRGLLRPHAACHNPGGQLCCA